MPLNKATIAKYLRECDLTSLFVEELGWNHCNISPRTVAIDGHSYTLTAISEMGGFVAFQCSADADGHIPIPPIRNRIDREIQKSFYEHLIVFCDGDGHEQVWLWTKKEPGKSTLTRAHRVSSNQSAEALIQKLNGIVFTLGDLDENGEMSIKSVADRVRSAFDVDKVTKKFYERFKKELLAFRKFIEGIQKEVDREWYASLMLNRLMFVYFIQKKGFLDGDTDYLAHHLDMVQREKGQDEFHTFYRHFLLRLFHQGLGAKDRNPELDALLGKVPYLNGGLFEMHDIEKDNPDIHIPDKAFEAIFAFFGEYDWHLDDRPTTKGNEINPDVLGYIFEKYINQKQMGAYYTKEDITEYISKNTIIPFIFDEVKKKCAITFEGDHAVWKLLQENPDRYIYEAVQKGLDLPLPDEIAAGLDDVSKRTEWNKPATSDYALPTEIWREVVARRNRYQDIRAKLEAGEVRSIDDLITCNLDIRQFAQDVIEASEGPDLLNALYSAVEKITVLDPTCGSGAFLFAALNILEPLYEACLDRMEAFIEEWGPEGKKNHPNYHKWFSHTLEQVAKHPNREYFILKSIILNNLYGVDIMPEAVEICKLRLFLKLVAQVDPDETDTNYGLEPLPDVDFNIRPGNTLVGFATYDEAKKVVTSTFDFDDAMSKIDEKAQEVDELFGLFRQQQTEIGGEITVEDKQELRNRLKALEEELNRYLARQYVIDADRHKVKYQKWLEAHLPFHWFVEFYGIMKRGGFDVIIGNPPWREYSAVKKDYRIVGLSVETCGNLHCFCTARANTLRSKTGRLAFIVQLPFAGSSRMAPIRELIMKNSRAVYLATFDDRPSRLFDGLEHCRCAIFMVAGADGEDGELLTTRYQRWYSEARQFLFAQFEYTPVSLSLIKSIFPKYGSVLQDTLFTKVRDASQKSLGHTFSKMKSDQFVFYQEAMQYWTKATLGLPYYAKNGVPGAPPHGRYLVFASSDMASAAFAVLNSSLFYAYFIAYSDCFHLSDGLVSSFPIPDDICSDKALAELGTKLQQDLEANAAIKTIHTKDGADISYAEFYGSRSKLIIDEIDRRLADMYGFSDQEREFVIHYDIKYRLGQNGGNEEEDE